MQQREKVAANDNLGKSSFDMTADEWMNVLEQMELNVKDYRVLNIKGAWRRARNAFFRNREEAVKKKEA